MTAPASEKTAHENAEPLLVVSGLTAAYTPQVPVLRGIDLSLHAGQILAVLGRNGAGRSSLLKALLGLIPAQGDLRWAGRSLSRLATHERARLGMAYVPETRDVFPNLSVHENLALVRPLGGASVRPDDELLGWFPELAARLAVRAQHLSGGEKQMLALARALKANAPLLLLDEPIEGLSESRVQAVKTALRTHAQAGGAVIMTEQKLALVFDLCEHVLVLGRGEGVFQGAARELWARQDILDNWLAIEIEGRKGESMKILTGGWPEMGEQAAQVRLAVFVEEQGIAREDEWDAYDAECQHAVAINDEGHAIGTGRLLPANAEGVSKVGRMAVLAPHRGTGVGAKILSALLTAAHARGDREVRLAAQASAVGFYLGQGFDVFDEPFVEVGIPHRWMRKTLV